MTGIESMLGVLPSHRLTQRQTDFVCLFDLNTSRAALLSHDLELQRTDPVSRTLSHAAYGSLEIGSLDRSPLSFINVQLISHADVHADVQGSLE